MDAQVLISQIQGRIKAIEADVATLILAGSYTDEQARDAIAAALTDSATIDFSADDVADTITGSVKPASISATMLDFDVATQSELNAHESDTSSVHGITDTSKLVKTDVAATMTANLTIGSAARLLLPDGTTGSAAWQFASDADNGPRRTGTNAWRHVAGGADVVSYGTTAFNVYKNLVMNAGVGFGINYVNDGDIVTLVSATSGMFQCCASSPGGSGEDITLPAVAISSATAQLYVVFDGTSLVTAAEPMILRAPSTGSINGGTVGGSITSTTANTVWITYSTGISMGGATSDWRLLEFNLPDAEMANFRNLVSYRV